MVLAALSGVHYIFFFTEHLKAIQTTHFVDWNDELSLCKGKNQLISPHFVVFRKLKKKIILFWMKKLKGEKT